MGIDYLIFGNVDSRDYGIEVFFKDVDRTPKRVYKSIDVPGRNGAVLIDENRYEDVPVSYDCIALLDADRKAFVNALAAQTGYKRMQDSFNDGEFYSAVFDGDVDPNVTKDRAQSTFSIYFTRAPQRYLISGETKLTVNSGDILTNPTLFESSPMLEVKGYGNIVIGGEEIAVAQGEAYGEILICSKLGREQTLDTSLLASGDAIYPKDSPNSQVTLELRNSYDTLASISLVDAINCTTEVTNRASNGAVLNVYPTVEFAYGTASSVTASATCSIRIRSSGGTSASYTATMSVTIAYDGDNTLTMTTNNSFSIPNTRITSGGQMRSWYGNSSVTILGNPIYIDLDIGEAWNEDTGTPVSINNAVTLGAELPVLAVGETEITFDNTITDLKVVPRWWRV